MRTRALKLPETEIAALKQAEDQTSRPNERRRMQAVGLFGSRMAVEQVVEVTGLSERTLQRQAARFREAGVEGLRERRVGGNRTLLTAEQRAEMAEKLHQYRPQVSHNHTLPNPSQPIGAVNRLSDTAPTAPHARHEKAVDSVNSVIGEAFDKINLSAAVAQ